ncbi:MULTISPECIES: TAT-variant-translocated molybdopterin oxidoreductase [unclassified Pedobacter]|uniref:TAT-variant-translocated molybdopterin oxidoreductase n=1 Tax=unclassified Pedobacter TaxID=2628915 RepID=UPI00141F657A|nr:MULTISPECIES: TAT-variant-translocated molybdopterin oxidoreductase [unclassified Pedobacter]NII85786.1 molybdopterin-containing oxidoreductase family iron-sulfur binding subunit [Pedobacter sp. SG908]NMN39297.1 molybdopterin-containing oxidoreductase family iron-sulfur binding subunit [Pedobacter sp. SG918]
MESNKKYWKGLEEYNNTPDFVKNNKNEFAEPLPIEDVLNEAGLSTVTPRRDFLKALGFGLGAVTLAACQSTPLKKSIPYLVKPEEVTPGIPNYYTSSFNGQSILVKTREGRPIKIEPNPNAGQFNCGTDARAQASVLDLYDVSKLKAPATVKGGQVEETTWAKIDSYVKGELAKAQAGGKKIRIVASTVNSPSTNAVIAQFVTKYPAAKLVQYDAVSYTGIIQANQNSFGKAVLPKYNFDKADLIVSFSADFLGTWISGEEFTAQYTANRNYKSLANKKMSRHIQFESGMSLTGTNADTRIPVKLSEEGPALIALYNAITGQALPGGTLGNNATADKVIKLVAKELLQAKGKGLVVCGSNDVSTQILVNAINAAIGSYGITIDLDNPCYLYAGNDAEFNGLVAEMGRGEVGAVLFLNSNPAYDAANPKAFTDALAKVPAKISFSDRADETATLCDAIAINHNYLESWGDANAYEGYYSIVQPTINPVFNSRQAEESLLTWADAPVKDYYQFVRSNWEAKVLPAAGLKWEEVLEKGVVTTAAKAAAAYSFTLSLAAVATSITNSSKALAKEVELQVYENIPMRDGKNANNAFLQELPDPVSKVTWDNFVAIAPKFAEKLKVKEFDVVTVKASNGYSVDLPVLIQPGQAQGTASIAVGYGRTKTGKAGNDVGKNAFPFVSFVNGTMQYATSVTITPTGGYYELAQTQTHHSFEGRAVIKEATFKEYLKNPGAGNEKGEHKDYDLWDQYEKPGNNWVMAIDLNACTGCGSCIVACNVENNIPVVGRDEVRRRREMHWIRIDRYYSYETKDGDVTREKEIAKLEDLDHVSVVHQPMLCQHCDHAPCETVCPVLATVHSSDGLNHMAYNRCVGTRYCANNCPYKVRRFNWFNYWNDSRFDNYLNNEFTQLVLNPDVTTRSRGVMEKCSMCIQRIQGGKLQAKLEKRPLKDGDIKMACQEACSANAIVFGDANDPNSEVSKALRSERIYYVLEEINVKPGIGYMTKIRNTDTTVQA